MTDEAKALVERLRGDWPEILVEKHWMMDSDAIDKQREEAADLIETQAREIERLRTALENVLAHRYGNWCNIAYAAGLERAAVIMEGEAKTLYRIAHMNLPAYSPTVARDRAQYCEGMADAIRAEKDKT